jgi:hypothetical protein
MEPWIAVEGTGKEVLNMCALAGHLLVHGTDCQLAARPYTMPSVVC